MSENPYQVSNAERLPVKNTRSIHWMIWLSVLCFALSFFCVGAVVNGMIVAFNRVVSGGTTPSIKDLAEGIRLATLWTLPSIVFSFLGIGLLVCRFVFRKPRGTNQQP